MKKIKEYLKNKKKKDITIFCVSTIIVLLVLVCSFVVYNNYFKVLDKITINNIKIEYGETIPKTIDSYIDREKIHGDFNDEDFVVDVKGKNLNHDYLLAGDYQLLLTYKDEKKTIDLTVEDKTEPKFTKFKDKISITEGTKTDIEKLNSKNNYWKAEDVLNNSKTEEAIIDFDGTFDYKTPGQYKITVVATDKNGLSVKKPLTIDVKKKENKKSESTKEKNISDKAKTSNDLIPQESESSQATKKSSNAPSGVIPPTPKEPVTKNEAPATPEYSGKITTYNDISSIRNAAESPQFAKYKDLCQALYDSYIYHKSEGIQFTVPISVDYKQLLSEIEDYMFCVDLPGINWGTGAIEGETKIKCAVRVYESSIEEYENLKSVGQWVKDRGLVGIPEEQAIEKLNAYLRDNTDYDYSYQDDAYEPIGIIKNNKAVCAGYAKMVKLSCDFLGIDAKCIVGTADGAYGWGSHAWNRVKIGSTWYYIDTCWNACLKSDTYYLSESLWSNHKMYQNYIY